MKSKYIVFIVFSLFLAACINHPNETVTLHEGYTNVELSTAERVQLIMNDMTVEAKALQMIQLEVVPALRNTYSIAGLGSVLSGGGSSPRDNTVEGWTERLQKVQESVMRRGFFIPAIYGIDAVHGHGNVHNATVFPQNIGLGAANDPELMEQMGRVVAEEMFKTRILWNFGPCVALAEDPRWGRSYESFSTDPEITADLAAAYVKGFQGAGGVATAKHYLGDGQTTWGTGMKGQIDRGDTRLSLEEIRATSLVPYKRLVEAGVKSVMISFNSVNGTKMHGSRKFITEILKGELGFDGFVVTDWEGIQELPNPTYEQQVWTAVNAGCDMLMEPYRGLEARNAIVKGVNNGTIDISRVNDAVKRILTVKMDSGLFEDPMIEKLAAAAPGLRDEASLDVSRQLVEKSMVLLKNDGAILPIKTGQTVLVLGPGADDVGIQCGGWTMTWQGQQDYMTNKLTEGTTLLESLTDVSKTLNFTVITDTAKAGEADLVILALAEIPYSEFEGDDPSPGLEGQKAHPGNLTAIETAESLGLPTAAVIIAGRHISIEEYLGSWDAVVMAYLPGTEGGGMGRVLTGQVDFSGTLPMDWYKDVKGLSREHFKVLYEAGFGLHY
ncbi:MAG: glycoside hydrolase family 3 protein [Spirochaetales bacterium]|nr:glycoside hydrolase family 3 protein [Spirochaetales bacterium]